MSEEIPDKKKALYRQTHAIEAVLSYQHRPTLSAADWPHTVAMLMGMKTFALIKHNQHLDVRKMLLPAFSPKTILQYIPRKAEIAEQMCAEWAQQAQLKGEHAMKAFTGKVRPLAI